MLLEWLRQGGVPMGLLLALSITAATLVIVKLWELWEWRYARLPAGWQQQRPDLALAQLGRERSPLAAALATAIAAVNDENLTEAQARERTEQVAMAALERMRGGFRVLEAIAQLAPLLGLFGAVVGLIDALQVQEAGGDVPASALAGAVRQALPTAAVGFAIAMPVIVCLHVLERIVDGQRLALETALTHLFARPRPARRHAP